jgi:hypothetical protein
VSSNASHVVSSNTNAVHRRLQCTPSRLPTYGCTRLPIVHQLHYKSQNSPVSSEVVTEVKQVALSSRRWHFLVWQICTFCGETWSSNAVFLKLCETAAR